VIVEKFGKDISYLEKEERIEESKIPDKPKVEGKNESN